MASEIYQGLPECLCGNSEPVKFRRYHTSDARNSIIGICCNVCYQEWVEDRFLMTPDIDGSRPVVELPGAILKRQFKRDLRSFADTVFKDKPSCTKITDLGKCFKTGDHIAWKRKCCLYYWHHAIVIDTNDETGEVTVIQWEAMDGKSKNICWNKVEGKLQIKKRVLNLEREPGTLYKIEHTDEIERCNPAELVIARAKSRIDEVAYNIFSDNCETFAYYCKTGLLVSHQVQKVYMDRNWEKPVTEALLKFAKEVASVDSVTVEEYPEDQVTQLKTGTQSERGIRHVQNGIALRVEGVYCLWDLTEIYQRRRNREMNSADFIAKAYNVVSEVPLLIKSTAWSMIIGGGCGILPSAGVAFIGLAGWHVVVAGMVVGFLLGSVLGFGLGKLKGMRAWGRYSDFLKAVGFNDKFNKRN